MQNKDYTRELFKSDVLKGKVKQIDELAAENEELKRRLERHQQQEKLLKEQNKISFRFLTVMLNSNQGDFALFNKAQRDLFTSNALKMIENCKLQEVNEKLANTGNESASLALLTNNHEEFKFNNILNTFSSLLNNAKKMQSSKISESRMLSDSTNIDIEKKQQDIKEPLNRSSQDNTQSLKENEVTG